MANILRAIVALACLCFAGAEEYAPPGTAQQFGAKREWTPPAADPAVAAANAALLPVATNQNAPGTAAATPSPVAHTPFSAAAPVVRSADAGLAQPQLAPPQVQSRNRTWTLKGKVDPVTGGLCQWPHCLPRCAPCQSAGKRVDTCYLHFILPNRTCAQFKPNSTCILGSCLCDAGYCATPTNVSGKFQCKKKSCDEAGRKHPQPPPIVRSPYLKYWMRLVGNSSFPPPAEMAEHSQDYMKSIMLFPMMLFIFGLVVAMVTGGILCCGCTGHHFVNGKTGSRGGGRKAVSRPNPWCLFVVGVVIVVIVTGATIVRMKNNAELEALAEDTLKLIDQDASTVARQALRINTTVQSFMVDVGKFVASCTYGQGSMVKGIMKKVNMTKMIEDMLVDYKGMVANYTHMTQPIPPQIESTETWIQGNASALSFAPNIPLIVLGIICLVIIGEVLLTTCVGSSSCAGCVDHSLKVAAVAFVLIIIAVASSICAGSGISIALSHFCMNPDANTLAYAKYYGNSSHVDDVTQFYLTGDVVNPVVSMADMGKKYIIGLEGVYQNFKAGIDFTESLCAEPADALNLTKLGDEAVEVLNTAKEILQARNIWPLYQIVVREGVCHDLIRSLSNMVVLQCLVGLILFPLCAILAHIFLVKWSDWEQFCEKSGNSDEEMKGMLDEEEDE